MLDSVYKQLKARPVDDITKILSLTLMEIAGCNVLIEHWIMDGIKARSAILLVSQLHDKDRQTVYNKIGNTLNFDISKACIKQLECYIFISYDFRIV